MWHGGTQGSMVGHCGAFCGVVKCNMALHRAALHGVAEPTMA